MTSVISEEQFWTAQLLNAGLPVKRAYKETFDNGDILIQAEFTNGLTEVQNDLFLSLTNPKKSSKNKAYDNAISIIVSAGLGGENVNDVNNNAGREALIRALCFQAGLCDHLGVLYGAVPGNQPNQQPKK